MTAEQLDQAAAVEQVAYTAEQAAALVGGLNPRTLLKARREGRLVGSKPGAKWLFTRADLEAWIARERRGITSTRSSGPAVVRPIRVRRNP